MPEIRKNIVGHLKCVRIRSFCWSAARNLNRNSYGTAVVICITDNAFVISTLLSVMFTSNLIDCFLF